MKDVMTISVIGLNSFAREITFEGKDYQVMQCSVNDAFEELDRARSLLKDLLMNHIDDEYMMNDIRISHEDLSNLGMSTEENLKLKNIPPREEWYE